MLYSIIAICFLFLIGVCPKEILKNEEKPQYTEGIDSSREDINMGWRADSWKLNPSERSDVQIKHDGPLHSFLSNVSSIPKDLEHTGAASFNIHLLGVQSVLRGWGADEAVADAGLFHSIYGTEGFQGFKLPLSKRSAIRNLIGLRADHLVWIFCMVDRRTVDASLYFHDHSANSAEDTIERRYEFSSRPELGMFPILLSGKEEWLDFLELSLADWLEQVEGAASKENDLYGWQVGEAWSYRRTAYHKMASILTDPVIAGQERAQRLQRTALPMLENVYAAEHESTRDLVQAATPPMTQAAKEALAALQAAAVYNAEVDVLQNYAPRCVE